MDIDRRHVAIKLMILATVVFLVAGCNLTPIQHPTKETKDPTPPPPPPVACRVQLVDLDMRPDPVRSGQAVNHWVVRLRHNANCVATLTIVDNNEVVGTVRNANIRPGVSDVAVPARSGYHFQPRDHCYVVRVNVQGNQIPIDAQRQFCAHYRSGQGLWTMKNP